MRVTNCTQNNIPKQSFGMKIKFHPSDVVEGVIPHVDKMIEVLTKVNATREVAEIAPAEVRLHYSTKETNAFLDDDLQPTQTIMHRWNLKFGDFKPKEITTFEHDSVAQIISRFTQKALDFAANIAEQQTQRAREATRIAIDAGKIKDAGLI